MTPEEFNAIPLAMPIHKHEPVPLSSGRQQTYQGRMIITLKAEPQKFPEHPHIVHYTMLESTD